MPLSVKHVGSAYADEEGETSPLRPRELNRLQEQLAEATRRVHDLRSTLNLPATSRGFAPRQAAPPPQGNEAWRELDEANAQVVRIRQWLRRQHASLTPKGEIVWPRSERPVVYDRDAEARGLTRVRVVNGRFYTAQRAVLGHHQPAALALHRFQAPLDTPQLAGHRSPAPAAASRAVLDTRHMVTHFSGPGAAIYVVSREGRLHVGSHSVGHRHHSSLLAGQPVAGAGELRVREGRLEWISNKSGHYRPDHFLFKQTLDLLAAHGVAYDFQIQYCWGNGASQPYPNVTAFDAAHAVLAARTPVSAVTAEQSNLLNAVY